MTAATPLTRPAIEALESVARGATLPRREAALATMADLARSGLIARAFGGRWRLTREGERVLAAVSRREAI